MLFIIMPIIMAPRLAEGAEVDREAPGSCFCCWGCWPTSDSSAGTGIWMGGREGNLPWACGMRVSVNVCESSAPNQHYQKGKEEVRTCRCAMWSMWKRKPSSQARDWSSEWHAGTYWGCWKYVCFSVCLRSREGIGRVECRRTHTSTTSNQRTHLPAAAARPRGPPARRRGAAGARWCSCWGAGSRARPGAWRCAAQSRSRRGRAWRSRCAVWWFDGVDFVSSDSLFSEHIRHHNPKLTTRRYRCGTSASHEDGTAPESSPPEPPS